MEHVTVRIASIALDNFKSVVYGAVEIAPIEGSSAGMLALYGQNGSGKTALIDSLDLLKQCLMGQRLDGRFGSCITYGSATARAEYAFAISRGTEALRARYQITIGRPEEDADGTIPGNSACSSVHIARELLEVSVQGTGHPVFVIDMGEDDSFGPRATLEALRGDDDKSIFDLAVAKRVTQHESRSFIFSQELQDFCSTRLPELPGQLPLGPRAIQTLTAYGRDKLFVSDSASLRPGMLPVSFHAAGNGGHGRLETLHLPMDVPVSIPAIHLQEVEKEVAGIGMVLGKLVPGLGIAVQDLGGVTLDDGGEGRRMQFLSRRGDVLLLFGCESAGIKKVASILQMLIFMYNDSSVTVAIDDLDTHIFEYLLGQVLHAIEEGGKGQLIFTGHNLRSLETLGSSCIAFTSVNPRKRYVRMNDAAGPANLRSRYLRSIMLEDNAPELAGPTSDAEIAYALRRIRNNGFEVA